MVSAFDEHRWTDMLADLLDPQESTWVDAPAEWITNKLQEFVTRDQRRIMEAVRDHRYVAVASCHDIGKSFSASRLVAWWLDIHVPGDAFCVTTAPTCTYPPESPF